MCIRDRSERCSDQTRALERLKLIAPQDALILLKASFSAPRVQRLLRCSPSVGHASLVRACVRVDDVFKYANSIHPVNISLCEIIFNEMPFCRKLPKRITNDWKLKTTPVVRLERLTCV